MAGRYDITIEQGATFSLPLSLKNSDNTAFNLTGYTGRGQIRKYHRSTTIVASFTVTISVTPTDGTLTVTMTAAETAALACGETIIEDKSKYVYDIEIVAGAVVKRILDGYAYVSPEVTR